MLSFVGRNTDVRSPSEQKFHAYQHLMKTLSSIFNINTNSTRQRIRLSAAKSLNPLLLIIINLHSVARKPLVMSSF